MFCLLGVLVIIVNFILGANTLINFILILVVGIWIIIGAVNYAVELGYYDNWRSQAEELAEQIKKAREAGLKSLPNGMGIKKAVELLELLIEITNKNADNLMRHRKGLFEVIFGPVCIFWFFSKRPKINKEELLDE